MLSFSPVVLKGKERIELSKLFETGPDQFRTGSLPCTTAEQGTSEWVNRARLEAGPPYTRCPSARLAGGTTAEQDKVPRNLQGAGQRPSRQAGLKAVPALHVA